MSETIATTVLAKVLHLGTEAVNPLSTASGAIDWATWQSRSDPP